MILSLSILNADLDHLDEFFKPINYCPLIHMDIMDGKFVPETSFNEITVKKAYLINPRSIIDVHLMVENPDPLFELYKDSYADYITFHYEVGDVKRRIEKIHSLGIKAGISINPLTDVKVLEPFLSSVDYILVMSVYPGLGGQKYLDQATEKLRYLKDYKNNHHLHYLISVDGGINMDTYLKVKPYTDIAVVGSAITKAQDYVAMYQEFFHKFLS